MGTANEIIIDHNLFILKIKEVASRTAKFELNIYFENKSSDKTIAYAIEGLSVNGLQQQIYSVVDLEPTRKSNKRYKLNEVELSKRGIEEYTDVQINFCVYDQKTLFTVDYNPYLRDRANIYPKGRENASKYIRESSDTDNVLIDNENVKVTAISYEPYGTYASTVHLYIENKSPQRLMFDAYNCYINGYITSCEYLHTIISNTSAYSMILWDKSALEINNIEKVEEIEFALRAYCPDNVSLPAYCNQKFKLTL